jgi:two-component system, OmpR family, alkaline phosphatase synthesis response regulator PhoP
MRKRILAADDEKHILRLIQINMERNGYEVELANDGREALERIAVNPPDMILLDVMMPYMDGFEVLKALKRNPDTRDIPVIMLTAKASDADVFMGWSSGVDCYLTKPFNPHELVNFVRRIFDSQNAVMADEGRYQL